MELTGQKLEKFIANRPSPDDVKGIHKTSVEATQAKLARRSLLGSLSGAFGRRPSIDELKARGIYDEKAGHGGRPFYPVDVE